MLSRPVPFQATAAGDDSGPADVAGLDEAIAEPSPETADWSPPPRPVMVPYAAKLSLATARWPSETTISSATSPTSDAADGEPVPYALPRPRPCGPFATRYASTIAAARYRNSAPF